MQRALAFWCLMLLLLTGATLRANDALPAEPTLTRFDFAHQLLRAGDEARDKGDLATAMILFDEATKEYDTLQRAYPDWEPSISSFRATYCREQLQRLRARQAAQSPPAALPPPAVTSTPTQTTGDLSTNVTPPVTPAPATQIPTNPPAPATTPPASLATLLPQARERMRQGAFLEARDILMQALRLNPDDVTTRLLIATAQCQLGHYQDAMFVLEMLNDERPNEVATLLALSAACVGVGQPQRASEYVRQALKVNPDSAEAHYNLARVLLVLTPPQPTAAEAHYQRALELGAPADPELERLLEAPTPPAPAP